MSTIHVRQLSYAYSREKQALQGVSLDIGAGALCGIIGPNGSGKTTLLGCISGYLSPDEGEVLIDGKRSAKMAVRDIAKIMALVRQNSETEQGFSVGDIVLMGRNPHLRRWQGECDEDFAAMNAALHAVGIMHLKHRLAGTLSGGERQMVVLARALCQQAGIMLLDEPVAGLDIRHQASILGTVRRQCTEHGMLGLCVLHDLNLALGYCDSLVLLSEGKVFAKGSPQEVLTKQNIEHVYGTKVHIMHQDGRMFVAPKLY